MSESKVSVIITCYNEGRYVSEAVQSVLAQTWAHRIERIIIVDDGSAYDTKQVVERTRSYDPRIEAIFQKNRGLPSARNRAIQEASSEYIAILDGDDLWLPNKLELQLPSLDAHPGAGISYTDLYLVEPENIEQRRIVRCRSYQPSTENVLEKFFVEDAPIIPSCVVLRRTVFDKVGLFDPELILGEDCEMWIRVLSAFKSVHIPSATLLKRARLNSLGADELRRLPFNDLITAKAVRLYPVLAPLARKRRARRLAKTAQYLEQAARRFEAWRHYGKAIGEDPRFLRAYVLFLLSFLPRDWSIGFQGLLRRIKHT